MAKKDLSALKGLALLTQIGFGMITPIIAGVFIGNYLDERFKKGHLFLIGMTLLGALTAFRYLYVMGTRLSRKEEKSKDGNK